MSEFDQHEKLYAAALEAIKALVSDTSVPRVSICGSLDALCDEIDIMYAALQAELERKTP